MKLFSASLVVLLLLASARLFALDRGAFTFTHYDLEVKIDGPLQGFIAKGKVTLRNDSDVPQHLAVLQISSTLAWQSVLLDSKPVQYLTQPFTSDVDHTGKVSEAIVTLPREVPPHKTIELEVAYQGMIPADSTRLNRIGVPAEVAARNDWDQISGPFTAVRGVGYVAWYPVSLDALNLSDGPQMFSSLNAWKARHEDSSMRVNLCTEVDEPNPPTLIMNAPAGTRGGSVTGGPQGTTTACREYNFAHFGLTVTTFAMANYTVLDRPGITVYYLGDHKLPATDYALAAESVLPFSTLWFGKPKEKIVVVEVGERNATPFESGPMLFTPVSPVDQKRLQLTLIHQLVHATFQSSRPWIYEGLAHFAQALEREQQDGRKAGLTYMDAFRPALVQAEKPAQAGQAGQDLVTATDEIFYRTKAMFVWWMLRDMVGDDALQRALQRYRADQDHEPSYVQRLLAARSKRDLEWFFDAWVYRDQGLPDFRVDSVYPRQILNGGFLVTVTVENLGNVAAEIPVLVRAAAGENSQRVMVAGKGKGVARIEMPAGPVETTVNDGSVPESDATNNSLKIAPPEKSP